MSDQERTRQRDHWQAIAEQLGLAADAEPRSGAIPEKEPEPASERGSRPASQANATEADLSSEEPVFSGPESEPEEIHQDTRRQAERAPETLSLEDNLPALESESEERNEEPERTSRPRGRRGRRGRGEESSRADEGEQSAKEAASSPGEVQGSEEQPERGRGRRRKGRTAPDADDQPAEMEATAGGGQEADDEIEELSDFSKWNVPSWNELIASLYRPER